LLKKNIIANFVGSIWQALMGLIFIPIYIKFIGIESWGLIGIFATLQTIFSLLDMGLSNTLNREIARLSALTDKEQMMRNLVRTLEIIYWNIGVLIVIIVILLSPFITHHWIKGDQLSPQIIEQSLLIMGFLLALQMLSGFYSGGLMGLQEQLLLNIINIIISTLQSVGACIVLWLIAPTIQAFFFWQILISIINIFLLSTFLWRRLPHSEKKGVFQKELFRGIWRFTIGLSGISALVLILTQLDKIILSKMLSLDQFGYYTLASMVAMSLFRLITPIYNAIYPKFAQLVSLDDQEELKRLYHTGCQLMSVLVLPVAMVVAMFSYEILLIWTHNPEVAENSHVLVSILICGTALNGIICLPFALQLSYGWTSLSFYKTLIAVIILVPLIIYLTKMYGATGGAVSWLILNLSMVFFEIPIMHRRLLRHEKWRWYWQDVGFPFIMVLLIVSLGRSFSIETESQAMMMLYIILISLAALGVAVISAPELRPWLYEQIIKSRLGYKIR
jgi:O-antigen/teichoic acid export membrane protein